MNRLIAAVILAVLIAGGCIWGQITVSDCDDVIGNALDQSREAAERGDFESAKKLAEKSEDVFADHEHRLSIFVDHDLVEDLGMQIAKLSTLAEEDTGAEFLSELDAADIMLLHIVRDNRPTLLNIL